MPRPKRSACVDDSEAGYIFGATQMHERLYTDQDECGVEIQCKVDRGFFLAENKWTCYRRNYFQLTGTFVVTRNGPYHLNSKRVRHFYFRLSGRQLEAELQVKLIQLTPKRDKGPQNDPPLLAIQPITVSPFGTPPIVSGESAMATAATFERIQFKSATANNGKKRASQQFFVLVVDLLAELDNGERVLVASAQSMPLVVRGRSPGHYADSGRRKVAHPPQQQPSPAEWTPSSSYYAAPPPPPIIPHPIMPTQHVDYYFAPHGRSQSANMPLIVNPPRWDFSPSSSTSSGQLEDGMYDTKFFHCYPSYSAALSDD
ncbi:hypothetical protein BJV82DRAFT_598523 [Fennellomyces sp. T-0311]|nr:hypothetical protein BJV82DRAFT_598523 [Fennellomyces sp. T-0311]